MHRIARTSALVITLALLAVLGACGGDDESADIDYPEGAVILQQNVPQPYQDFRLVAININDTSGFVIVELPDGGNERLPAEAGQTISTSDGSLSLDVVAIEPPDGDDGAPGQGSGRIIVVPKTP